MYDIIELNNKLVTELRDIAKDLNIPKYEKLLKQERVTMLLIPAPRALSSDCGLAIRYAATERQQVEDLLTNAALLPEDIYLKEKDRFVRVLVD